MAEAEMTSPSTPQTPARTPGTPGGPLLPIQAERFPSGHINSFRAIKCFTTDRFCAPTHTESFRDSFHYPPDSCIYLPTACAHTPIPSVSLTRKVVAEFIGTFLLIFAGAGSAIVNEKTNGQVTLLGLAAAPGMAVMVVILATGHISGAHINPCLTISFAVLRHFPWFQVPLYLSAQAIASICASFALKGIFSPALHGGVTVPSVSQPQAFALEFIISFALMFVVTAVATDTRAVGELAGIAVGATVVMNILIAGPSTGAAMNPVRTLGPAIAAKNYEGIWLYMVAPILGALLGALCYSFVRLKGDDVAEGAPVRASSVRSFRR